MMNARIPALLLLSLPLMVLAVEPKLPELKLSYSATWNGFNLGEIVVTLKPDVAPDCYRYESSSSPVGLVRMFYGKPRELSQFCVAGGRVIPKRFEFIKSKRDNDNFTLEFDAAAGKVKDQHGGVRDIPPNAQDRFALQQAVRLWVLESLGKKEPGTAEFAMVEDDRVKVYRFAITSYEAIEIPAGRFETVLVQRVDNPDRISKFWLAPARDYMPVKVEQGKNGKVNLSMELLPSAS